MGSMDWITEMALRLAANSGLDPAALLVDATDAEVLLELAGVAAHTSGERTNAPLLCFVLGRAVAQGATLDDLARLIRADSGT
jgi:Domain of unknown function (DUF6457)